MCVCVYLCLLLVLLFVCLMFWLFCLSRNQCGRLTATDNIRDSANAHKHTHLCRLQTFTDSNAEKCNCWFSPIHLRSSFFMVIYSGHQIHLLWLPWLIFAYFRAFVNIDMYNINIIIIIRYRSVFFSSIVAPNGWFAFRCNENKTGAEQNWNKTNPFPYNRFRNNAQLMRTHFSLVFHLFRGKTIYRFLFLSLSLSPSLSRSLVVQSDTYERTYIYHFQKKENRPQWKCANWTNKHEPKKKSASLIANVTLR